MLSWTVFKVRARGFRTAIRAAQHLYRAAPRLASRGCGRDQISLPRPKALEYYHPSRHRPCVGRHPGQVAEWFKALDSKSSEPSKGSVGSTPTLSAFFEPLKFNNLRRKEGAFGVK